MALTKRIPLALPMYPDGNGPRLTNEKAQMYSKETHWKFNDGTRVDDMWSFVSVFPTLIRLYTEPWPYYRTLPVTEFWEHLRWVWHAERDVYSSGHLVLSLLGLAFVHLVETSDILYRLDIPLCDITGLKFKMNLTFHQILVSMEHLQRVWHANRGSFLLRTPCPVPFSTCICSTCWDQSFSQSCHYFSGLCTSNIPLYFLDFSSYIQIPWVNSRKCFWHFEIYT